MSDVSIGTCSYCGSQNVPIVATPETGLYCIECHRLTRDNCNDAIRKIKRFQKLSNFASERKDLQKDYKEEAEKALFDLCGEHISLD